ncbi:MAG TPA: LLM class flavin-dependent oxidoreductase [Acidimicrobiia bacterium]|nr:LLM class flavin-dependent oxidoreductase [Acidimicrobiia bacterium]
MDIGIGLPTTIDGVDAATVLEWARRAEGAGFSSLGTIDRLVYGNWESLVALSAAAAVTERIKLMTSILLTPLRPNAAMLAKQTATIDRLSGGRLVLGLAVGGRADDYEASGVDITRRGRVFDAQLAELRAVWSGERGIGPSPARAGGPEVIIGGTSDAAVRRVVDHASGWIAGGGGVDAFAATATRVRDAWAEAGRDGRPRLLALGYYSLGPAARTNADAYIQHYYGFLGPVAEQIAQGVLVSDAQVRDELAAFESAGCDEVVLFPSSPDVSQVDLLAAARG